MIQLTIDEVRVLGVLMEKEKTTPEQYPLTLNAITLGSNQKSNRNPIVAYTQETVVRALDGLRDKNIVWECSVPGSRVPKYRHTFADVFPVTQEEEAILTVLMLRGPQTAGEIKGRCGRLHEFQSLNQIQKILEDLISKHDDPYVVSLPRQPGRKENRHAHLLSGQPDIEEVDHAPSHEPARLAVEAKNERLEKLEETVAVLQGRLADLEDSFLEFTKQFE
jgi:uncharacterized protein YceH (UPF0502 family)